MVTDEIKAGTLMFAELALMIVIILDLLVFLGGIAWAVLLAFTDATSLNPAMHVLATIGAAVSGVLACCTLIRVRQC